MPISFSQWCLTWRVIEQGTQQLVRLSEPAPCSSNKRRRCSAWLRLPGCTGEWFSRAAGRWRCAEMKLVPEDAEEGARGVAGPAYSVEAAATQHKATGVSDSACAGAVRRLGARRGLCRAAWLPARQGGASLPPSQLTPHSEVVCAATAATWHQPDQCSTVLVPLCWPTHCLRLCSNRSTCVRFMTAGASATYALPKRPPALVPLQAPPPVAQRRESVAAIQGIQSKLALWERKSQSAQGFHVPFTQHTALLLPAVQGGLQQCYARVLRNRRT